MNDSIVRYVAINARVCWVEDLFFLFVLYPNSGIVFFNIHLFVSHSLNGTYATQKSKVFM